MNGKNKKSWVRQAIEWIDEYLHSKGYKIINTRLTKIDLDSKRNITVHLTKECQIITPAENIIVEIKYE